MAEQAKVTSVDAIEAFRAKLIVYPGAPHGITDTHKDKLNADLLTFIKS